MARRKKKQQQGTISSKQFRKSLTEALERGNNFQNTLNRELTNRNQQPKQIDIDSGLKFSTEDSKRGRVEGMLKTKPRSQKLTVETPSSNSKQDRVRQRLEASKKPSGGTIYRPEIPGFNPTVRTTTKRPGTEITNLPDTKMNTAVEQLPLHKPGTNMMADGKPGFERRSNQQFGKDRPNRYGIPDRSSGGQIERQQPNGKGAWSRPEQIASDTNSKKAGKTSFGKNGIVRGDTYERPVWKGNQTENEGPQALDAWKNDNTVNDGLQALNSFFEESKARRAEEREAAGSAERTMQEYVRRQHRSGNKLPKGYLWASRLDEQTGRKLTGEIYNRANAIKERKEQQAVAAATGYEYNPETGRHDKPIDYGQIATVAGYRQNTGVDAYQSWDTAHDIIETLEDMKSSGSLGKITNKLEDMTPEQLDEEEYRRRTRIDDNNKALQAYENSQALPAMLIMPMKEGDNKADYMDEVSYANTALMVQVNNGAIKRREEGQEGYDYHTRMTVYDMFHGEGAYLAAIQKWPEKKDELNRRIDQAIDNAFDIARIDGEISYDNHRLEEIKNVRANNARTDKAKSTADTSVTELITEDAIAAGAMAIEGKEPTTGTLYNTGYVPENDTTQYSGTGSILYPSYWWEQRKISPLVPLPMAVPLLELVDGGWSTKADVDHIYSFINKGYTFDKYFQDRDPQVEGKEGFFWHAEMMNDEEKGKFNALYNAGKKDEAMAFVKGLETVNNYRAEVFGRLEEKEIAHVAPVSLSVATVGATLTQPAEQAANLVGRIFGDTRPSDPNSAIYRYTRMKNLGRADVAEQINNEFLKTVYNSTMSAADCAVNFIVMQGAGFTGEALKWATLAIFSSEAFQSSMEQKLQETHGNWEASACWAAMDATIETCTEIFSVEALMADPKNFIMYILKASGSEASEEFVGSVVGPLVQEMVNRKNEWKVQAQEIWDNGGYYNDNNEWVKVDSYDKACKIAAKNWMGEIWTSTLSGALSVGPSLGRATVYHGIDYLKLNNAGSKIMNQQGETSYQRNAGPVNQNIQNEGGREMPAGLKKLVQQAQELDPEGDGAKLAQKISERWQNKGKTSNAQVGKLYYQVVNEQRQKLNEQEKETRRNVISEHLAAEDMSQEEIGKVTDLVDRAYNEGMDSLSRKEQRQLRDSKPGMNMLYELQGKVRTEAVAERLKDTGMAPEEQNRIADLVTRAHNDGMESLSAKEKRDLHGSREGMHVYDQLEYEADQKSRNETQPEGRQPENNTVKETGTENSTNGQETTEQETGAVQAETVRPETGMEAAEDAGKETGTESAEIAGLENGTETAETAGQETGKETAETAGQETGAETAGTQTQGRRTIHEEIEERIREATEGTRESLKQLSEMMPRVTLKEGMDRKTRKDVGEQMATQREIREIERRTGERAQGHRSVVVANEETGEAGFAQLVGVKEGRAVIEEKRGENTVRRTVSISEIGTTNFGTAAILRSQTMLPGIFSDEAVNRMLNMQDNGRINNAGEFLREAARIRIAGMTGTEMSGVTLDSDTARELYNEAHDEEARIRESEAKNAGRMNRAANITFQGVNYNNTEAWKQKLADAGLDAKTVERMEAAAGIAQRAGVDLTFRTSGEIDAGLSGKQKGKGKYVRGSQSAAGIMLNVDAVYNQATGGQSNILVTFGHELTHWLQTNSLQGYNRLSSFVMSELKNNGANIGEMILTKMENYARDGQQLDLHGAISEIVANACDQILLDEEVQQRIEETRPALAQEIKNFVRNLTERIRKAIRGTERQFSGESLLLRNVNGLAKAWLGAYDEAISARIRETETTPEETAERKSLSEVMDGIESTEAYTQAAEALEESGEVAVVPARYSFAGENAGGMYGEDVRLAKQMHAEGYSAEEIMEETGCVEGFRGRWWKVIDNGTVSKEGLAQIVDGGSFLLDEIYETQDLYRAYPQMKDMWVMVHSDLAEQGAAGMYDQDTRRIWLSPALAKMSPEAAAQIIRHEVQHAIQHIEGSNRGSNVSLWQEIQEVAGSRLDMDAAAIRQIGEKYNIDMGRFNGFVFREDGSLMQSMYSQQEWQQLKQIQEEDLAVLRSVMEDVDSWVEIAEADPRTLYWNTVGEMEARAAEGSIEDQQWGIRYNNAVAVEDFEGETAQAAKFQMSEISETDQAYADAVERGDLQAATDMLMDKLAHSENIIPYRAAYRYAGEHIEISKQIKRGVPYAIARAAEDMASFVPDNAVLVPMPPHTGIVTEETDTMVLARAIGELTNRPVVAALTSNERESRYQAKLKNRKGVSAEKMGFRQVEQLPEGTFPVFIDNMVSTGETAKAATQAMGGGITLAYSKSVRSPGIVGLKKAVVTYDDQNNLIPLSQRFDASVRDVRYQLTETANGIRKGMTDEQRYEKLKGMSMKTVNADGKTADSILNSSNGMSIPDSRNALKKLAMDTGIVGKVYENVWLPGIKPEFSNRGLKETLHYVQGGFKNMAMLMSVFEETFRNAIPISMQGDRYRYIIGEKDTSLHSYIQLLGAFRNGSQIIPVKFEIKDFKNTENGSLYIVATINRDAIKTTAETHNNTSLTVITASPNVSIEDVIKNVNKEDIDLLYFIPKQFLSEEQLEGKREGLEKEGDYIKSKASRRQGFTSTDIKITEARVNNAIARYGEKSNNNAYMAFINPGAFVELSNDNPADVQNGSRPMNGADLRAAKETPTIRINPATGEILGADGSKRMAAMAYAGVEKVSVLIEQEGTKGQEAGDTIESLTIKGMNGTTQTLENLIPVNEEHREELVEEHVNGNSWMRMQMSESGMDVNSWMMGLSEGSLRTESERQLLRAYKDLKMKVKISDQRLRDYNGKLKGLTAKGDTLTFAEREDVRALRNRIEVEEAKNARLVKELEQVTGSEGYAGMMYEQNEFLQNNIYGKTQEQVNEAVGKMVEEIRKSKAAIARRQEALKKLGESDAVKFVRSQMSRTSLEAAARLIRKELGATMNKQYLMDRLSELSLRAANGESIMEDATALAKEVAGTIRGEESEDLAEMRGTTFLISPSVAKELKAENSSLAEIRSKLKGSGIKIRVDEHGDFAMQWEEFRNNNKGLPDLDEEYAEIDKLHRMVDFIQNQVEGGRRIYQDQLDMDFATALVLSQANMISTDFVTDPAAKRQMQRLTGMITEMQQESDTAAEALGRIVEQMESLLKTAMETKSATRMLKHDIGEAIKYFNETSKIAAQVERQKVKENIIDQLKSENARKLIQQQEAFREQIKNDRKARGLAEDNLKLRQQTSTVVKRLKNLLVNETDRKNIPEEAKPLARLLCRMIVDHDLGGNRRITFGARKQLLEFQEKLQRLDAMDGGFDYETGLDFLVIGEGAGRDTYVRDKVEEDLKAIESGLLKYTTAEGHGLVTLQDRKDALKQVQEAVSEIMDVIRARQSAFINGKRMVVEEMALQMEDEMQRSKFKGERTGKLGRAVTKGTAAVNYGNLTPEYFFKRLKNSVLASLHNQFHIGENKAGLQALRAKRVMNRIAEEAGYEGWDVKTRQEVRISSGRTVQLNVGEMMSLYATWKRESMEARPEETSHLLNGGFVINQTEDKGGLYGRQKVENRPVRVNAADMVKIAGMLTDQQKQYVDNVVEYMSTDLAELGNEVSMDVYGVKKFGEKYYFPIKSWEGNLNRASGQGIVNNDVKNRGLQQGFSKRLKAGANNAIEIGDFTQTATNHIIGMIQYNTIGPAVEYMNRVLNQRLEYGSVETLENGDEQDNTYKRNIRAAFGEYYGQNALKYLETFLNDINGGTVQDPRGTELYSKLLGTFKKGAVAGSLSVAFQQPISYIRAAMMINPKYLAMALNPVYYKGSYNEMMEHSGVAVIKEMGRFDMGYGQSMKDFITPDGKQGKGRAAWEFVKDKSTFLPELMDRATWTRMWSAVKLEMHEAHPEMDMKSDAFLDMVAERFNDVMRKTQVYDSVLVKSQNMRSQSLKAKTLTAFMGEPTLTLNVLEDAISNFGEKGGKAQFAKAFSGFVVTALLQSMVKGAFRTGRSPDKDKTWLENFINSTFENLLSEINPLNLIPGYGDMVELLTKGELNDDAYSVIGKLKTIGDKARTMIEGFITGEYDGKPYRDIEDTAGQLVQIFSGVPLKNLMRDVRAIANWCSGGNLEWLTGNTYAKRDTSWAVIKYGMNDTAMTNDLFGAVNVLLGKAGYQTGRSAYYKRLYDATRSGNTERAGELTEYLTKGLGAKEDTVRQNMRKLAKEDESISDSEKADILMEEGSAETASDWVLDKVREGTMSAEDAWKEMKRIYPDKSEDDIWWKVDRAAYKRDTGKDAGSGTYYRMYDAIEAGKSDGIRSSIGGIIGHGVTKEAVRKQIGAKYKSAYLEATGSEKVKIKNSLIMAYKATGLTDAEANKIINGWKPKNKK